MRTPPLSARFALLCALGAFACDDGEGEAPLDAGMDAAPLAEAGPPFERDVGPDVKIPIDVPPMDAAPPPIDVPQRPDLPPDIDEGPLDAAPDAEETVCDPPCAISERCDKEQGRCVPDDAPPAGPCEEDAHCAEGRCVSQDASQGRYPDGFCEVPCEADDACGPGGVCVRSGDGMICQRGCLDGICRAGWACAMVDDTPLCVPDCRESGCPGEDMTCDLERGLCVPADSDCPHPCGVGAFCQEGRCIRVDGTCSTEYNCARRVETCFDGACAPPEGRACLGDDDCDARQICRGEPGICRWRCEDHAGCPLDRVCEAGACVEAPCGGEAGGILYGECAAGDGPGTCMPRAHAEGEAPGLCVYSGATEEGLDCEALLSRRGQRDELLCAPGLVCYGDDSDALDPTDPLDGGGRCVALCAPESSCAGEMSCVDFSVPEDPETETPEAVDVGLCLPEECDVVEQDCPQGLLCRPYLFSARAGVCGPAGPAADGEVCGANEDCAGSSWCANVGEDAVCLPICVDDEGCGEGGWCFLSEGWAFGVCR